MTATGAAGWRAPADPSAWRVVVDGVMGGVSEAAVAATPDGALRFAGTLRLEHGGGFASIRTALTAPLPAAAAGLTLDLRGDGRCYRLTLFGADQPGGAPRPWHHHARFVAPAAPARIALRWAEFSASFRGRPVVGAERPDPARLVAVGLMITKAEYPAGGPFALEVAAIGLLD